MYIHIYIYIYVYTHVLYIYIYIYNVVYTHLSIRHLLLTFATQLDASDTIAQTVAAQFEVEERNPKTLKP